MARSLDLATRDALAARMRFYRELGLTDFYRRPVDPAFMAQLEAAAAQEPLLSTIPLQVFAASVAQARGYDVDKPRNLAKSVTVE